MTNKRWEILLFAYLILYGAFCLSIGIFTHFHAGLNDFLGNFFMAAHLNVHEPSSFYNGFFPLGYAVFVRLISFGHPFVSCYIANILFGLVLLGSVAYLTSTTIGRGWAMACVVTLSLTPKVFTYITTPGPDMGTSAFIAAGVTLLIISATKDVTRGRTIVLIIIGGMLFGLSALWRYNGLPLGVGFMMALGLITRKYRLYVVLGLISIFLIYSVQWWFNLASGHGLMETATNFNVYITMYGVSFEKVSSLAHAIPHSTLRIIMNDPAAFLRAYHRNFAKYIPILIPSLLGMLLLKDEKQIKVSSIIFLASAFYLAVVTIGAGLSQRADLPAIPFCVYQWVVLASFFYGIAAKIYSRRRLMLVTTAAIVMVAGWIGVSYARADLRLIKDRRNAQAMFAAVQTLLIGEGVTNARQVFATDPDLYFSGLDPYEPYTNGGWERFSMYGLNEQYPELSTEDMKIFLSDCQAHSISHLALDESASDYSPELGRIYTEELQMKQFQKIAQFDGLKIFEIEGISPRPRRTVP